MHKLADSRWPVTAYAHRLVAASTGMHQIHSREVVWTLPRADAPLRRPRAPYQVQCYTHAKCSLCDGHKTPGSHRLPLAVIQRTAVDVVCAGHSVRDVHVQRALPCIMRHTCLMNGARRFRSRRGAVNKPACSVMQARRARLWHPRHCPPRSFRQLASAPSFK